MTHRKYDGVQQIATGTGVGALTLGAATSSKYRTFSGAGAADGDTGYFRIQHSTIDAEWEVVKGTLSSGTLVRTFDSKSSSSTGALISFSAGNKIISMAVVAPATLAEDPNGDVPVTRDFTVGRNVTAAGRLDGGQASNLASAATVNIGAANGNYVHITGVVAITAFDSVMAGIEREVVFDGVLTLTHNATSLILPTGQNIQTAAGDMATFRSEGSGNWRCTRYVRADGSLLNSTQTKGLMQALLMGRIMLSLSGVNFNSANSDNAIAVTLPTSFTRFLVERVQISHASGTITTATAGLFTAAAGGGTAVVTGGSALTVSTASESTNNNTQSMTINNAATQSYALATVPTLYFRVGTAQGAPRTADVTITIIPLP